MMAAQKNYTAKVSPHKEFVCKYLLSSCFEKLSMKPIDRWAEFTS